MGGLLNRCNCTFSDEAPDVDLNQIGDSSVITEQNNALKDQELQTQQKCSTENTEKDFYSTSLVETLNNFRHQELFVDFTVKVDGNIFPVHKNVPAASCEFFRDLFDASEHICCEMQNVEPSAVEHVLNFLYTGKCTLNQQNAASILSVARMLGLHDLQEASERCLSSAEDASNTREKFFVSQEGSVLKAIREMQVKGLFCDMTLTTCSGRVVPVHKNILAAISCYFQGLFRSDMKEAKENNVDFGVIDEPIVTELLNFIYSGIISITFDNIRSLLRVSDYLLIESLKTAIDNFLKGSLTASNFWQLFALAKSFDGLPEINKGISQMACNNYWEITKSGAFLEISEDNMRFFLSNDDIVASETQMLESLVSWYKYSMQQREESFKNLLHFIHMSSIPDHYLKFLAEKEGIGELLSHTGHQYRERLSLDEMKRTAHFYNLALIGLSWNPHRSGNQLFYWLPFSGPWSFFFSVSRPPIHWCGGHPFVFHDSALYLQVYDNVQLAFINNPLSARHFVNCWLEPVVKFTESLSAKTQDCTAVTFASCIYLIGGNCRDEAQNTVHRYNIVTQSWDCVSSMQERRCYHCAVNYMDKCIYVFGGVDRVTCYNRVYKSTVERYDPEHNSWSYVASMHQPRYNGLACVFTHKIFVIGGESTECASAPKCEVYDPVTDEWQMGSFQIKEIFTLNGKFKTGTLCSQMFDPDTNKDNPLEPKVWYHHGYIDRPSATCCNGLIILVDFGSFFYRVRLPFYFVNPETGNFRILYSLPVPLPFRNASHGVIKPLSRKDMIKALKDYPKKES